MKLQLHWRGALRFAVLVVLLGACRKGTPEVPNADADQGVLTALRPPVAFRVREQAKGQALGKGDSVDVMPGANVITAAGGHAGLAWGDFLALELASGTDLLVSMIQPGSQQALFDQASGTIRYRLPGDTAVRLKVQAATWMTIEVGKAPADIVVSLMPGPDPAVWVAVVKGAADGLRGGDKLRLKGGQVGAFTAKGALPRLMDVDREALSDWYDDYAGGKNPQGSPADFLFRCMPGDGGVQLRQEPEGSVIGSTLAAGTPLRVGGRSADAAWVFVMTEAGKDGWAAAADLGCNGPLVDLAVGDGRLTPVATAPTEVTPLPRPLVTRSPTPPRTPTASPTPLGPIVTLTADSLALTAGECTNLHWTVKGARSYSVNGSARGGEEGTEKVCPKQNMTYTLTAVLADGSELTQEVRISVRAAEATAVPTASATKAQPTSAATAAATATAKPTAGPTAEPTAISLPADTPQPTAAPTDAPTAEPQPSNTP